MTRYNPAVITKGARKLYERANFIVFIWACLGSLAGLITGLLFGGTGLYESILDQIGFRTFSPFRLGVIVITSVFTIIGILIGLDRSFMIRLKAQMMLCQLQTEKNTRSQPID